MAGIRLSEEDKNNLSVIKMKFNIKNDSEAIRFCLDKMARTFIDIEPVLTTKEFPRMEN